ncbi:MAG: hypothetical protein FWG92_02585 [Leptospirales bacterium]|nr:hypothetical protein [Leptospirales bacterium]
MKKLILSTLIAICCAFVIMPNRAHALDITVGASTWYAWWDQVDSKKTTNFDPRLFYGPALAVKLNNDFNLTFVYLYGVFEDKESGSSEKRNLKYKRSDADFAINYRLSNYFKVFAGIKYMPYSIKGTIKSSTEEITFDNKHSGLGPGLGLSATIPIIGNMFALATVSGFYLWSEDNSKYVSTNPANNESYKSNYKRYGFNSTLSIAYYIAPASTVVSLGGRYQYFRSDYSNEITSYINNTFYGVTLTATYTFSI